MQIEHNIPIPKKVEWKNRGVMNTFRAMKVGDSFTIESNATSMNMLAKRVGIRVTVKEVEPMKWRVWRIE